MLCDHKIQNCCSAIIPCNSYPIDTLHLKAILDSSESFNPISILLFIYILIPMQQEDKIKGRGFSFNHRKTESSS